MTAPTASPAESTPLVSVCIPCHNAEAHLRDTLESVSLQTYGNIEVIAVCDRSSDRTAEILRTVSERSRLKWVKSDLGSAAKSRNLAFSLSEGEFIKYLDADDLISPDLVALQVARLRQTENCIASARWKRFQESIDEREFAPDSTWADRDSIDWLVESFREGGIHSMMQCGMFLIPRRLIEIVGGWDERLTLIDDTEFFCGCSARLIGSSIRTARFIIALDWRAHSPAENASGLRIGGACDRRILSTSDDS